MKLLKINSLLAGTLALVLIAGMTSPAFAQQTQEIDLSQFNFPENLLVPLADEADSIFFNGAGHPDFGCFFMDGFPPGQSLADDFVLDENNVVTDVHFDGCTSGLTEFNVIIYNNVNGLPGGVFHQTTAIEIEEMTIEDGIVRYWFDLADPISLEAGVTYWLEVNSNGVSAGWLATDFEFGEIAATLNTGNWFSNGLRFNFILTGPSSLVGGELLPIDSTALLLASAQTFSWMIPVVLSVLGIGLFVVSRKSE